MRIIDIPGGQGSDAWREHRRTHLNASDAAAMMGCSPYETRTALLRRVATGVETEPDQQTQALFSEGHRCEAMARPLAEEILGEDLYPIVVASGRLSASLDGATLDGRVNFEHKMLNDEIRLAFDGGPSNPDLPLLYRVQMEHQHACSVAERTLFMASRREGDKIVEMLWCWYTPDAELRSKVLAGWEQFEKDVASYAPQPAPAPAPVGKAPDTLPALLIQVAGSVTASNLDDFKAVALGAIRSVNRNLQTDQDFADAEKAVKWCSEVESKLKQAKEHALSQTATIDALFKALDDIGAEARTVRLDLDKLVTRRKAEAREEAIGRARSALAEHVAVLNAEIAPMRMELPAADFGGAIRGLKTMASVDDKLSVALASAKIDADAKARSIRANVAVFKEVAAGLEVLFCDLHQLVHKSAEDFRATLDARIAAHRDAEAKRKAALAEAESRAAEAKVEQVQGAQPPAAAAGSGQDERVPVAAVRKPAAPPTDDGPPIKLGEIGNRLGFKLPEAFIVGVLNIQPAGHDKSAALFWPSQWPQVKTALIEHIRGLP